MIGILSRVRRDRVGIRLALGVAFAAAAFSHHPGSAHAACPNEAIREAQGSQFLPACMAFEMVSPPLKGNQAALEPTISAAGGRVLFYSRAGLGGTPGIVSPFADPYLASRGAGGWITVAAAPPVEYGFKGLGNPAAFSAALGGWLALASTDAQGLLGQTTALQGGLGVPWVERAGPLAPLNGLFGSFNVEAMRFEGASADLSHLAFIPGVESAFYLQGDPEPSGPESQSNTYVVSGPPGSGALELLARDKDDKVWGGTCGAWLGGGTVDGRRGGRNQGAIAADGSRMYFSTRPGQEQPEAEDPASPPCDPVANPIRILKREVTPGGVEISELIEGGPAAGDDLYQGASVDGDKVFLTSPRKLTASDEDASAEACGDEIGKSKGCDLYLYDRDTEELIQASAGDGTGPTPGEGADVLSGVTAISGDGTHVYFVAQGVLTTDPNPEEEVAVAGELNLYLYQRDAEYPAGRTAFIGRLDKTCTKGTSDNGGTSDCNSLFGRTGNPPLTLREVSYGTNATAVPVTGKDVLGAEIGGDGHVLVFESFAALTADDKDGLRRDAFAYDGDLGTLRCVSCGDNEGAADDFDIAERTMSTIPMPHFAERNRWADEAGEAIVFATAEALVPGDEDGAENPYLWHGGELVRLPGERVPGTQPPRSNVAADGQQVAFQTATPLVPQDGDTAEDVYVARVDGGFPPSAVVPPCVGELGCQGVPALPPPSSLPASEAPATSSKPKCPKGTRPVKRKGKVRCVVRRRCAKGKRAVKRKGKVVRCVKVTKKRNRAGHRRGGSGR